MRIIVNTPYPAADLITEYSTGAKVYLDSSSSETGSYTNVASAALVSGTEQYELYDNAGTAATWYKSRFGNTGGSLYSDYGAPFQATSLVAYATIDDVRRTLTTDSVAHDNLLSDMLTDVSADIDAACQRRFYRDPQVSGTVTVYADVLCAGERSLAEAMVTPFFVDGRPLDIVSITNLYTRADESSAYVEVTAGDTGYYLDGYAKGVGVFGTDWCYEDVTLSPVSTTVTTWPVGRRAVKIVGVLGFPKVPASVRRATVSEVRERFRQSIGGGPMPAGVNQFGQPIFLTGDSPDMRRVTRKPFSRREMVA